MQHVSYSQRDPLFKVCAAREQLWGYPCDLTCCILPGKTLGLSQLSIILVDKLGCRAYTMHMLKERTVRAKRSDRNHIIYELRVSAGNYIGVTAKTESTVLKSVRARAAKHYYRAKTEAKNWLLCQALRELASKDDIEIIVHEIIRGKTAAHHREVELRRELRPSLNTDTRGD